MITQNKLFVCQAGKTSVSLKVRHQVVLDIIMNIEKPTLAHTEVTLLLINIQT